MTIKYSSGYENPVTSNSRILQKYLDCRQELQQQMFEEACKDPVLGRVYRHIGRSWFVSIEEANYWAELLLVPKRGQDSAMQEGLEI